MPAGRLLLTSFLLLSALTVRCWGHGSESFGYVDIRADGHMFWWLMRAGNGSDDWRSYPLVLWLEGGPGSSSTGYSNFRLIGPYAQKVDDASLIPRPDTWLRHANLLFVDSPLGAGFSYVTNETAFARNDSQVTADLLLFIKAFVHMNPDFQQIPLIIAGESYGGKTAVQLAKALQSAVHRKEVRLNVQSVLLADAAVSPFDACAHFSDYLHAVCMIDGQQKEQIDAKVQKIKKEMENKTESREASRLWIELREMIETMTFGVNWDNILQPENAYPHLVQKILSDNETSSLPVYHSDSDDGKMLSDLMNGLIRSKLSIIPDSVTWGSQKSQVFDNLMGDFMFPAVDEVEHLLNNTAIKVFVYSGQLDLVGNSLGTEAWIRRMHWTNESEFRDSRRLLFSGAIGHPKAYIKASDRLTVFWIMSAGHLVPADESEIALQILSHILATV